MGEKNKVYLLGKFIGSLIKINLECCRRIIEKKGYIIWIFYLMGK